MRRTRLRPMPDLDAIYTSAYDHSKWADHVYRIHMLGVMAHHATPTGGVVADLSCGDAAIARRLIATHGARAVLGDYVPGYEHTGPIEQTIHALTDGSVDLYVCTETLEHLDDPDEVLKVIRRKARYLLVSTPDGEWDDRNPEHVWGWDAEAVGSMLREAGWAPQVYGSLDLRPAGGEYVFQMWLCQ